MSKKKVNVLSEIQIGIINYMTPMENVHVLKNSMHGFEVLHYLFRRD